MIHVDSIQWVNDAWEARSRINEGVYHLQGYPVRITHLAYTDDPAVQSALQTVVRVLLERHMRRGAVPPHAMVMDWSRAQGICQGASAEMEAACRIIAGTNLFEVGSAVSNHF
ncbi:hypothetical protein [Sulfobacillus harzensis]|uniref:Uncharacterized protein n=1 Tax=Sulfobacillus harzensis TaxID=2729629 RepID=A0A7Y0L4W3_9FIRM|nr:hypothetical protein [Sulfobacillus harzensis]NMP23260.1 hypothetical protein [Sulfobacillus harzensis]